MCINYFEYKCIFLKQTANKQRSKQKKRIKGKGP